MLTRLYLSQGVEWIVFRRVVNRDATHLSIGRALLEDPRGLPLLVAAPVVHGVPATAADLERGPTTSTTSSDTAAKS